MDVDFSRCVACFNCVKTCEDDSIHYKMLKTQKVEVKTDESKRSFFKQTGLYGLGLLTLTTKVFGNEHNRIKANKTTPVTPPGSRSLEHFTAHCTACNMCVTVCPTQVLQPSFLEYGFTGMLMPRMDYTTNYCNYECTKCSEICPTGAILPLTHEEKSTTQIGRALFHIKKCVVYTDETFCGSCSEHCPTQAVTMVPYKGGLTIPHTRPEICVGCGACEYACPVRPERAITVNSNVVHQIAEKPEVEKLDVQIEEDFPF